GGRGGGGVGGAATARAGGGGGGFWWEPPQPPASRATPARRITSRRTSGSLQPSRSEVRLLDGAARGNLGGGALGDNGARAEDEHAVGDAAHEPNVVLDHQHRHAAFAT